MSIQAVQAIGRVIMPLTRHPRTKRQTKKEGDSTLQEVARLLDIDPRTIRRYQKEGYIPKRYFWEKGTRVLYLTPGDIKKVRDIKAEKETKNKTLHAFRLETKALKEEVWGGKEC